MLRRISVNLILAFVVFPIITLLSGYIGRYILQDYTGFSGNLEGYTLDTLRDIIPAVSLWMLLGVLFPFEIGIYIYRLKKKKGMKFIYQVFFFLFFEIATLFLLAGLGYLFASVFTTLKIIIFFLAVSFTIVSLHYYFIERKYQTTNNFEEKNISNQY